MEKLKKKNKDRIKETIVLESYLFGKHCHIIPKDWRCFEFQVDLVVVMDTKVSLETINPGSARMSVAMATWCQWYPEDGFFRDESLMWNQHRYTVYFNAFFVSSTRLCQTLSRPVMNLIPNFKSIWEWGGGGGWGDQTNNCDIHAGIWRRYFLIFDDIGKFTSVSPVFPKRNTWDI